MSKKDTTNTFSEGMIKDLNPINMPNNALSDCLNGTIITYNSNEFSLQNDQGNYPLENCKLKSKYIPVGLKEYGDILYIVSYNPLDRHVEIGSYPAPETIKDSTSVEDPKNVPTLNSIKSQITTSEINYSKIISDLEKSIVFYGEGNPEDFKLNPGDKYKLNDLILENTSDYEYLDYFILDENRQYYNINSYIKNHNTPDEDGFINVGWNIPGWFGIKTKFVEIEDFKVNIRKAILASFSNVELKLNFQIIVSNPILRNVNDKIKKDFTIDIEYKVGNGNPIKESINNLNSLDLNNGTRVYYIDWSPENAISSENESDIEISIIPKIKISNLGEPDKFVIFDSFIKKLHFNTKNKLKSINDISLGENSWWYNIDSNNLKLTLKFDTQGILESSILNEDLYLFYSLYTINENGDKEIVEGYNRKKLENWNLTGDTIIEFNLDSFPLSEVEYTNNLHKLYPEDIYLVKLELSNLPELTGQAKKSIEKIIIASELMNDFKEQRLDLIPFDKWIERYKYHIKNNDFIITENTPVKSSLEETKNVIYSRGYYTWKTKNTDLPYKTFIPLTEYEDNMKEGFSVKAGVKCNVNIKYNNNIKTLVGPLWLKFNKNLEIENQLNSIKTFSIDPYTGKCINAENIPEILKSNLNIERKYKFSNLLGVDSYRYLWNYKSLDLRIPSSESIEMTGFANTKGKHNFNEITVSYNNDYVNIPDQPYYNNNKNYTGTSFRNLLKYISNKSEYNKYDFLVLKINIGLLSSNSHESMELTSEREKNLFLKLEDKNKSEYSNFIRFVAFKVSDKLVLIQSENYGDIKEWANSVEHIICDPDSLQMGSFFKADFDSMQEDKSLIFTIKGKVIPHSFFYKKWDLLDNTSRKEFNLKFNNCKNLEISSELENSIITIEPIEITSKDVKINLDEILKEKSGMNQESIETSLKNKLLEADTEIVNFNEKYILQDFTKYIENKIFTSGEYNSYSNVYIYKENTLNNNNLLEILNGKKNFEEKALYFMSHSNHNDNPKNLYVYIGYNPSFTFPKFSNK